jgi:RNA 3'-terminal phosphate cyclase (ATP)
MIEGGGQILRTSLALATLLGKDVEVKNIRAGRSNPGLRPQHLVSVKTLARLCNAKVKGLFLGSKRIVFKPGPLRPMQLSVNIGTAGSLTLLVSQLLPATLVAETKLRGIGGTDVPFAPPASFLTELLFPTLRKMGARFSMRVLVRGYYPKGQGTVVFESAATELPLKPLKLLSLGRLEYICCVSHSRGLPCRVVREQAIAAKSRLHRTLSEFEWAEQLECSAEKDECKGCGVELYARHVGGTLAASALGRRGVPATSVGTQAAERLISQLSAGTACDIHLSDQLIPFIALAKGRSEFIVSKLTRHAKTNIAVTEQLLDVKFKVEEKNNNTVVAVKGIGFA